MAVGAMMVGSITVGCDTELHTNKFQFSGNYDTFDQKKMEHQAKKGEEFGVFNAGSTIVMIFEAPKDMQWKVKVGDIVKVGDRIINIE